MRSKKRMRSKNSERSTCVFSSAPTEKKKKKEENLRLLCGDEIVLWHVLVRVLISTDSVQKHVIFAQTNLSNGPHILRHGGAAIFF